MAESLRIQLGPLLLVRDRKTKVHAGQSQGPLQILIVFGPMLIPARLTFAVYRNDRQTFLREYKSPPPQI